MRSDTEPIVVYKGRTVYLPVSMGFDISNDTFKSQIRVDKDPESDLIAEWDVSFVSDGADGELMLTLFDTITSEIDHSSGFMDMKRTTGGEPVNVFDEPLEVLFKNVVTV